MEKQLHNIKDLDGAQVYKLAMSIGAPRLIAWISTYNQDGTVNVAPYAMSGVVSVDPLIVQFCSIGKKLTYQNVTERKAFVFNIPSVSHRDLVAQTGKPVPADETKVIPAEITTTEGLHVDAPIIDLAQASFECELIETKEMGSSTIIYGKVKAIHTAEGLVGESGAADFAQLNPLTRLGTIEWGETKAFI
ncbi:flavin reductase family protein [Gleimia sp. 6138-11-ORH1]|uniref:flavin reductase family protein n=1 Tax=Gleimia sp. 6138-11-ORH1 TaxID=2973937 RepID=UPI002168F1CD|nr:flavin reductase family protein [Gleimia sp. 6138-11-ORH1]MCS4484897.1 flavin reductase family protein [Gleimia sp. 6138-11-ORH1]